MKTNLDGHVTSAAGLRHFSMTLLVLSLLCLPDICMGQALSGPQKIVIDTAHDRLLISNYNTGNIIQVDGDGHFGYFVQGAEFVDGMEIVGNTVYGAAPCRRIKGYDLDTGLPTPSVTFPGPGYYYVSSVVADDSGHLFVSCPPGNCVFKMRISDGTYSTFVSTGMNRPNGMIYEETENRLIVVEDRANPSILAVDLADSTAAVLKTTSLAGADGIAKDAAGNYYVTGYYLPGIYKFDPAFAQPPEMIYAGGGIVYPTYDASDNSLLVTRYDAGSVPDVVEKGNGVTSKQLKPATPAFAGEDGGLRHGRVYQI